jgi:hypothetical protein
MELSLQNVLLIGSVSENLSHATGLAPVVQRLLNYSVFSFLFFLSRLFFYRLSAALSFVLRPGAKARRLIGSAGTP